MMPMPRSARKWLPSVIATFMLGTITAQGQVAPSGKYALLVGVSRYVTKELRSLPYAERDVTDLAKVLRDSGYKAENIVLLAQTPGANDPRFSPLTNRIREELRLILKHRSPGDTVLIAFAGHGVHFKGDPNSYFCPADTDLGDKSSLISLTDVYADLEKCPANLKVLFVDACRNDPFQNRSRRLSVDLDSVTRPPIPTAPGGVIAFFSCSEKEQAFEHEELKHGVFFHFVIEGLRGEAGKGDAVTVPDLAEYVSRRVSDYVRAKFGVSQTPELVGKMRGRAPLVSLDMAVLALRRGTESLRKKEYDRAVTELTEAIRRNPKNPDALVSRGDAHYYKNNFDLAIGDYTEAIRIKPAHFTAYKERAATYLAKEQPEKAVADLTEALRIVPKSAVAARMRGTAYTRLKKYDQAIADCSLAIQLDPKSAYAYAARGDAYYYKDKYDDAIADYTEAIRLDPKFAKPYRERAYTYIVKKQYDQALEDLKIGLQLEPQNPYVHNMRGLAFIGKKANDQALAAFADAIARDPKWAPAYFNRGRVFHDIGQHRKAVADFTTAIQINPDRSDYYAARGKAFVKLGDPTSAQADLDRATRLQSRK